MEADAAARSDHVTRIGNHTAHHGCIELASTDFAALRRVMREPLVIDGRNLYDPAAMRDAGFDYLGIGRGDPEAVRRATSALAA